MSMQVEEAREHGKTGGVDGSIGRGLDTDATMRPSRMNTVRTLRRSAGAIEHAAVDDGERGAL